MVPRLRGPCRESECRGQRDTAGSTVTRGVGPEALSDICSKPHSCSHATPERTENPILSFSGKYPYWGAQQLKARLEPGADWPATSTFGNILQRAGLTSPKRRKRRTTPYSETFSEVMSPNQLWCMDFKGYSVRAMARVAICSPLISFTDNADLIKNTHSQNRCCYYADSVWVPSSLA